MMRLLMTSRQTCCDGRPERHTELVFNKHSFTIHSGPAEQTTVHVFRLFRFTGMLLSSLGFPSK